MVMTLRPIGKFRRCSVVPCSSRWQIAAVNYQAELLHVTSSEYRTEEGACPFRAENLYFIWADVRGDFQAVLIFVRRFGDQVGHQIKTRVYWVSASATTLIRNLYFPNCKCLQMWSLASLPGRSLKYRSNRNLKAIIPVCCVRIYTWLSSGLWF